MISSDGCLFKTYNSNYQFIKDMDSLNYDIDFTGIIESYEYYIHEWTAWYRNGKLHRLDGPAVIYNAEPAEFAIEYWFNGNYIKCSSQEQFNLYIDLTKLKGLYND